MANSARFCACSSSEAEQLLELAANDSYIASGRRISALMLQQTLVGQTHLSFQSFTDAS